MTVVERLLHCSKVRCLDDATDTRFGNDGFLIAEQGPRTWRIIDFRDGEVAISSTRSRTRLRANPVNHFVDPSLGTAALGIGVDDLLRDLEAAGLHFESLVLRDLRIYAQAMNARLSSWRDSRTGAEVDVVLKLP